MNMLRNYNFLLFCLLINYVTSFNYISINLNKLDILKPKYVTKQWKINIDTNPKETYYDWLNIVWYNDFHFNSMINSKIITFGDIYGTNSMRSLNFFNTVNQVITNTSYPSKILYKEYVAPSFNSNKGEIKFINNNNKTEVIWNLNYTCLPHTENFIYKMYDDAISTSLKKVKTYSERKKYQNELK